MRALTNEFSSSAEAAALMSKLQLDDNNLSDQHSFLLFYPYGNWFQFDVTIFFRNHFKFLQICCSLAFSLLIRYLLILNTRYSSSSFQIRIVFSFWFFRQIFITNLFIIYMCWIFSYGYESESLRPIRWWQM